MFSYANLTRSDVIIPVGRANGVSPAPDEPWPARDVQAGRRAVRVRRPRRAGLAGRDLDRLERRGGRDCPRFGRSRARLQAHLGAGRGRSRAREVGPAVVGHRRRARRVHDRRPQCRSTTARAITVLDRQLDSRVEVLSATTASGRCEIRGRGTANQRVLCVLRDLGPGESATIVVAARALEPGVARNRATVVSVPPDVGANNSDTAAATIRGRQQQVSPGGAGKRPKPPFTG